MEAFMGDADARNEVTQMAELIDMTSDDFPECENCNEPTKRIVGKTFDVDGPGQVGTMYDCDNGACNALRQAKIRAWNANEPGLKEMERFAEKFANENLGKPENE